MTIEFDDPIYNEREDEETNLKLLDAQDQAKRDVKEFYANPADNCTAEPEDLIDIMVSQQSNREYYQ